MRFGRCERVWRYNSKGRLLQADGAALKKTKNKKHIWLHLSASRVARVMPSDFCFVWEWGAGGFGQRQYLHTRILGELLLFPDIAVNPFWDETLVQSLWTWISRVFLSSSSSQQWIGTTTSATPAPKQTGQTCRLMMLYKIQSGLAHCPTLKAKLVALPSRQRRTHEKQLCWPPELIIEAPPKNHQGLELVTHESSGGPNPWRFWIKGIKLKNYL